MSGLAISAFLPSITSGGIFSTRRAASAANANNPFVGAMNADIAGGQALNVAKGVSNIAKYSNNTLSADIISAEESIKNLAKTDKDSSKELGDLEFKLIDRAKESKIVNSVEATLIELQLATNIVNGRFDNRGYNSRLF